MSETTAIERAFRIAEARKAEADEAARLRDEALMAERIYDPRPYAEAEPVDQELYEGTGIGALYGFPGSEHFLAELDGWTLGREA